MKLMNSTCFAGYVFKLQYKKWYMTVFLPSFIGEQGITHSPIWNNYEKKTWFLYHQTYNEIDIFAQVCYAGALDFYVLKLFLNELNWQ